MGNGGHFLIFKNKLGRTCVFASSGSRLLSFVVFFVYVLDDDFSLFLFSHWVSGCASRICVTSSDWQLRCIPHAEHNKLNLR